jgi:two-component SAPR family response regulator
MLDEQSPEETAKDENIILNVPGERMSLDIQVSCFGGSMGSGKSLPNVHWSSLHCREVFYHCH